LGWRLDALGEDDALEKILESIPGFYKSDFVEDLPQWSREDVLLKTRCTLRNKKSRSSLSNSSLRTDHNLLALDAASAVGAASFVFEHIISGKRRRLPHFVEIGHFLKPWDKSSKVGITSYVQFVIAHIVAYKNMMTVGLYLPRTTWAFPEKVLRGYLAYGESVLLTNFDPHHSLFSL